MKPKSPINNKKTTNNTRSNILGTRLLEYLEEARILKKIAPKKSEIATGIVSGTLVWGVNHEELQVKAVVLPNDTRVLIPIKDRFAEEERVVWISTIGQKYKISRYAKVLYYSGSRPIDTKLLQYVGNVRSEEQPTKTNVHNYTLRIPRSRGEKPIHIRDMISIVEMSGVPVLEGWSSINDTISDRIQRDNPDLFKRW